MVLFWICCAVMTAGVVLLLTRPLRNYGATHRFDGREGEIAVYRDQLAEIEADKARGLITQGEAEAARIEIARRILALDSATGIVAATARASDIHRATQSPVLSAAAASPQLPGQLFMAFGLIVPAMALMLYASLGSPGMPAQPLSERMARAATVASDVSELVSRVETQLRANPTDGQGWDVIAPIYLRLGRPADAVPAYQNAIQLLGETPRRLAGLAEASVLAADGVVNEQARTAYLRLLELEPGRVEARFGLALALEQDGDLDRAAAAYRSMLDQTPADAPWRQFVTQRLDAIEGQRLASAGAGAKGDQARAAVSSDQAATIASLPEGERRRVIEQMVEGLAARLKVDGRDVSGWQRLLRSWSVLGRKDQAEAALRDARKALAGDEAGTASLEALAKELGLKS